MNEELVAALNIVLGNTFQMYYRAHSYHWNVEGPNFPQYHAFFEMIYKEVYDVIDTIAEHIRQLGDYVPSSVTQLVLNSKITNGETGVPDALDMLVSLNDINDVVIASLKEAYMIAEHAGEIGVSNFLQDRVIAHQKHGWMLKATAK